MQRLTGAIVQPFDDAAPSIPIGFTAGRWGSLAAFEARSYPGTRRKYGTGNSFVAAVEFARTVTPRRREWDILPGMRLYTYGERSPEIVALLRERSFQGLVGALFRAEEPALPCEPPPVWHDAVRLDLLASAEDATPAGPPARRYRAGRRLVLVPAAAGRGAADLLHPALTRYAEIAGDTGARLRVAYGATAAAERFSWPQVSHALLAGLFLDLAMGREVLRSGRISRRPAGDSVLWAFQGVTAENAYGVSMVPAGPPHPAAFVELWHRKARPAAPRLSPSLVAILAGIARGEQPGGSARELLVLKHLKLVRTSGGAPRLQVPAFGASDAARLRGPLEQGARQLVADAIDPALELLESHPWWRERVRSQAYRHAAIRLILEHGIDRAIAAGVCDPFPEPPETPVEWGRCLWDDPAGDLLP